MHINYGNKGIYRHADLDTTHAKRSTTNIVNDTMVKVAVDGSKHGLNYGGKIELNADTSQNKYDGANPSSNAFETMVYVSNHYGRIEGGATTGTSDKMNVRGASLARATGGTDGDYVYAMNQNFNAGDVQQFNTGFWNVNNRFWTTPTLPSNYHTGGTNMANKASYFTPTYMGFKAGVSYIPDMEAKGTLSQANGLSQKIGAAANGVRFGFNNGLYRNVLTGGIHYKGSFSGVKIKASVLGESGTAKNESTTILFQNLRAVQAGLSFGYKGFKIAGSYADLGKSGINKAIATGKRKTTFWDAAVAYKYHALGLSVSYFESKRGGFINTVQNDANAATTDANAKANKYTAWSFGVDYKLAPGFLPYAEYTAFKTNDANKGNATASDNAVNNKGHVFLAGTKLEF